MANQLQAQFVDLAQEDSVTAAQVTQLQQEGPPWTGVSMQCSNGLYTYADWFGAVWKAAGPGDHNPNYGRSTFRMAYHYFVCVSPGSTAEEVAANGVKQANIACDAVAAAGGWATGDLAMGVDIENGEQPEGLTATDVTGGVTAFADQVLARTGRRPILYGGSLIRALGITSRMGCAYYWFPEWSPELDWTLVQRAGWDEASTLLWQDVGDGSPTAPPGYSHITPIGGNLDISTMVLGNMPYDQQIPWLVAYCAQAKTA